MIKNIFKTFKNIIKFPIGRKKIPDMAANVVETEKKLQKIVFIRCAENDYRLRGSFEYELPKRGSNSIGKVRTFNFNRLMTEPASDALERIRQNVWRHSTKKCKSKRIPESVSPNIELTPENIEMNLFDENGCEIDKTLSNSVAWVDGGILQIGEERYLIEMNPPEVLQVKLPSLIMSGFPLLPCVTLQFAKLSQCDFTWLRADGDKAVCRDIVYIPTHEDIGFPLKLVVIPKRENRQGDLMESISTSSVTEGPNDLPFLARQKYTAKETLAGRVVSYNILAETYSNTDFSREKLFAHCPTRYLDYAYRKPLIAKELLGYNSDIICLQEVDRKHFNRFYQPLFDRYGYNSLMFSKQYYQLPENWNAADADAEEEDDVQIGAKDQATDKLVSPEGSAVFFKNTKFRQIGDCSVSISQLLQSDAQYSDVMEKVSSSKLVNEILLYRSGSSLQVVVLESVDDPSRRLCICTTHLYYHPLGSVVRLLQTDVALRYIQQVKSTYEAEGHTMSVLFCGDFNSTPNTQLVQFIRSRIINNTDKVWTENKLYRMTGMDLSHQLNLDSACGYPKYTNYVPSFQACIDYIFYEREHLFVESIVPLPGQELLTAHGDGIPSQAFPSDHLPLICELSWK